MSDIRTRIVGMLTLVVPFALAPTVAITADADGGDGGFELEEVLVTATKRSTDLQKTPASIGVVDGEEIRKSGKTTLSQILQDTAGVSVNTSGNFGYYFWVRGIGSAPTFGQDPAVTMSVNGVFNQMAQSSRGAFFDVDRVEVTRGPQSTLNGRNAMGGSVAVVTAEPRLGEFDASASIGAGNYNLRNGQAVVNAPLGEHVALRVSASAEDRDGYLSNGANDSNLFASRARLLFQPSESLSVILSADLSKTSGKGVGSGETGLLVPNAVNGLQLGRYCSNVLQCATAIVGGNPQSQFAGSGYSNLPLQPDMYTTFAPSDPNSREFDSKNYYLDMNWDLGWGKIFVQPTKSSSNAVDYNQTFSLAQYVQWSEAAVRLHGAAAPLANQWTTDRMEQFARGLATGLNWTHLHQEQETFELRVSSPDDSRIKWLAGVYTFENSEQARVSPVAGGMVGQYTAGAPQSFCVTGAGVSAANPFGSGCPNTNTIPNDATVVVRSLATDPSLAGVLDTYRPGVDPNRTTKDSAIYASLTFPLSEQLNLTVGGRHTRESKWREAESFARTMFTANNGVAGSTTGGATVTAPLATFEREWNITDYQANLTWDYSPEGMVYLALSTGFRGGAFLNIVDSGYVMTIPAAPGTPFATGGTSQLISGFSNTYDPERLTSYEIGTRNDLLDGRMRLNVSVYHYQYDDYQYAYSAFPFSGQDPDAPFVNYITNVGSASSNGLDLELRYLPTANDELRLSGTYLNTKLGAFTLPGGTAQSVSDAQQLRGLPLRRAPKWTLIPSYRHRFPLGAYGSLTAGIDAHFEDESYTGNLTSNPGINAILRQASWHRTNLSLTYENPDARYSINAWARNIDGTEVIGTVAAPAQFNANVTSFTFDPGEPRTYGINFSWRLN